MTKLIFTFRNPAKLLKNNILFITQTKPQIYDDTFLSLIGLTESQKEKKNTPGKWTDVLLKRPLLRLISHFRLK